MSLFEKAKEIGQEIKESPEFKELQRTSQNIQENADAQQIIQDVQTIQKQLQFSQNAGVQPDQEQLQELDNLKVKIDSNIIIRAYMKAEEDYTRLMQEVNQAISEEINNSE